MLNNFGTYEINKISGDAQLGSEMINFVVMKRILSLIALLACFCGSASAQPLSFKGSEGASVGIYIAEIGSRKIVADYNSARTFIPASVTKCVTAASAMLTLSPEFRFRTEVRAYGTVRSGVLHGNVVIIGGGDPTIGSRHFANRPSFAGEFVKWLKSAGIDSIAGSVLVSEGAYPEIGVSPYWLLEDTPWEYGAGYYGLNYRDNSFAMTVSTSGIVSMTPRIESLSVELDLSKSPAGEVTAMRGEGSDFLYLYGAMSGATYGSRYSIPRPSEVLLDDVFAAMSRGGIGCSEDDVTADRDAGITPMVYSSPTAPDILRSMMEKSNNLFAESMLRAQAIGKGVKLTDNESLKLQKKLLEGRGHDFATIRILDGCGLAPGNKITPRFLGGILEDMASGSHSKGYVGLYPLAGKEGTVRGLLANTRLAGKLALKSGSMSGVLCYAGYKIDANHKPTHVVVIMVNGFVGKGAPVRKAIADYLLKKF